MKVYIKPKHIETYEAITVDKECILTDTPLVKQEILREDGQWILRETSIDSNDVYRSTTNMDVYLDKGDILIKVDKGYMKPINKDMFVKVSATVQKAIDTLNK